MSKLSPGGAFALNGGFVAGLFVLSQLAVLQDRPMVRTSIMGAALFLLVWGALLFGVLRRRQKVTLQIVMRRQHYLQACLQGSLILYWGCYWREVYHAAPLIAAQLLFAYGFDSLLLAVQALGELPARQGVRLLTVTQGAAEILGGDALAPYRAVTHGLGRAAPEEELLARPERPRRCTLPITALRVMPPSSPAIWLAESPSAHSFFRSSTRSSVQPMSFSPRA